MAATLSTSLAVLVLLQLSLSLICMAVRQADVCRATISQLSEMTAQIGAESAVLPCTITPTCSKADTHSHWFVFRQDSHHHLSIQLPKYSIHEGNLSIHSVQANDSGVYYCAATLKTSNQQVAPSIGSGTRLVVRENPSTINGQALLWSLFAIAAVYSLIVLILLIYKKTRWGMSHGRKRKDSSRKPTSTRRAHFRAVLQELYGKRSLPHADRNTNHQRCDKNQFEHPHTQSPDEDVYQNM
ncbi:uncharacterized protein si:ch211-139g16.8 [Megalops cyprinoides]|uniref:uncharacterized protein si:ch211-139g16.8 n=1 Tax=Megalops cyprinoides TaxID=118141 RepID=UPI001863A978|nr:uncharacterized protein si:ch211-139g16.8 [Megalops cyprinoides]